MCDVQPDAPESCQIEAWYMDGMEGDQRLPHRWGLHLFIKVKAAAHTSLPYLIRIPALTADALPTSHALPLLFVS